MLHKETRRVSTNVSIEVVSGVNVNARNYTTTMGKTICLTNEDNFLQSKMGELQHERINKVRLRH